MAMAATVAAGQGAVVLHQWRVGCPVLVSCHPEELDLPLMAVPTGVATPVVVDESVVVATLGTYNPLSYMMTVLSCIASRLGKRAVIVVHFFSTTSPTEMIAECSRFPVVTRRVPAVLLVNDNPQVQLCVVCCLDADEFPSVYGKIIALLQSPIIQSGTVTARHAVVF
eukprot:TRINITY_DN783_c0_g1_i1.p2 TRINITY_DN783_c0_g1~~TRINITY_DN783_c0_g1_i1.p2  ORF type:complete len:168 (-),score=32.94 TRINITY_DN783_c0_g1_i1:67-570(-)